MNADEILKHKRLALFKNKILFDWDGVPIISLFDAAEVLEIQKTNAYKLLKQKKFEAREFGGAKFVSLDSVVKEMQKRDEKNDLIAFKKASVLKTMGIAPAKIVKEILKQLPPDKKQKALNEIFSSVDFREYIDNRKDKPKKQ